MSFLSRLSALFTKKEVVDDNILRTVTTIGGKEFLRADFCLKCCSDMSEHTEELCMVAQVHDE